MYRRRSYFINRVPRNSLFFDSQYGDVWLRILFCFSITPSSPSFDDKSGKKGQSDIEWEYDEVGSRVVMLPKVLVEHGHFLEREIQLRTAFLFLVRCPIFFCLHFLAKGETKRLLRAHGKAGRTVEVNSRAEECYYSF